MKDEYIKRIEEEITISEERLKILKSIRDSKLEIYLGKIDYFKYGDINYKIQDNIIKSEKLIRTDFLNVGDYLVYLITIKEKNMNSVSFDEYISYSSKILERIRKYETLSKIELYICGFVKKAKQDKTVFKEIKRKPLRDVNKNQEKEVDSASFTFNLRIVEGKIDFVVFVSFNTRVSDENVAVLSSKLKITIDPFGDEFIIHNSQDDPMNLINVE